MVRKYDPYSLIKLGLSGNEASCYLALVEYGGASSATAVAKHMGTLPNAVYRLLDNLVGFGMVVPLGTSPKKYQPVPPQAAIEAYVQHQSKQLEQSKLQAITALAGQPQPHTSIGFITGQDQFFATFVKLAQHANEEILVISIGEPVADDIKLATRDALARGVTCKFMFHKSDNSNAQLLKSWAAMGVQVGHYPDSGFHLLVFDSQKAVLVASNPVETTERTGMIITSSSLANAMREFFYARWGKALMIKK